ncbi:MAG: ATP-binding protein [Betaproteobacteria bacterium]|nr:ATP-binding protein [Betaproteobacteria bacterium]
MALDQVIEAAGLNQKAEEAKRLLGGLVQKPQYVGEVFSVGYEEAVVVIHDSYRERVGGIPSLSFLLATRIDTDAIFSYQSEDASVLLLRVMDAAPLPNQGELERLRADAAQRASGEDANWDDEAIMDGYTRNQLSFAGVRCRIIGTFYIDDAENDRLVLKFGSDISNYYPNRGLKVYKPRDEGLQRIVNFRDPARMVFDPGHYLFPLSQRLVPVGEVRYASTNRQHQGISNVRVDLSPLDLVDQKTALFGMTRTGKSNTVKVIARSIFELRYADPRQGRIGQLIFDYNGEYANENIQDGTGGLNAGALKNVWRGNAAGRGEDVVTYGSIARTDDPRRKLTKLNFYAEENLQLGKEIINAALAERSDKYLSNFRDVAFGIEDQENLSEVTRHNRTAFAYRALLAKAGFTPPANLQHAVPTGLFNQQLLTALSSSQDDPNGEHGQAARLLGETRINWHQAATAMEALHDFIRRGDKTGFQAFNQTYMNRAGSSGEPWADQRLRNVLGMFEYRNGSAMVARVQEQHSHTVGTDYADELYSDLVTGRLVIIDQSAGSPEINKAAADRIMTRIFVSNLSAFTGAQVPPKILIYIEEAHNLLPSSKETDLQDIWVRAAKEGAKLGLGLVYSTQEVSSIQKNILKNTANWFIGHLNSTEETKELNKFYDFADFERSILRAQDKGFIRVKTLSNSFVIPVQVDRFEVPSAV